MQMPKGENMNEQIKIFKSSEKLDEAFGVLCDKLNAICKQYQLNYYEFFGLIRCFECDLIKQDIERDEEDK